MSHAYTYRSGERHPSPEGAEHYSFFFYVTFNDESKTTERQASDTQKRRLDLSMVQRNITFGADGGCFLCAVATGSVSLHNRMELEIRTLCQPNSDHYIRARFALRQGKL